jgi:hypothetical protein
LPFLDSVASPQESTKLGFDFAERLLHANRVFVGDLLSTVVSVLPTEAAKTPAAS